MPWAYEDLGLLFLFLEVLLITSCLRQRALENVSFSRRMKELKIIVPNEGPDKNVITLTPPMCFTHDNARHVVDALDRCLSEIELGTSPDADRESNMQISERTDLIIPIEVVSGTAVLPDARADETDEPDGKRPKYEDLD